jgi:hypothetical protein
MSDNLTALTDEFTGSKISPAKLEALFKLGESNIVYSVCFNWKLFVHVCSY